MAAREDMIAATAAGEAACQALAAALADYVAAYRSASASAWQTPPEAQFQTRASDLEGNIGPHRFTHCAASRLAAGAASQILLHSAAMAAGPECWEWLVSQVEANVPEEAALLER